ncbi:MAG: LysM peptidoglycan-binding domain-containing protein [Chloroflexota bacterium]
MKQWVSRLLVIVLMMVCIGVGFLLSRVNPSLLPVRQETTATPLESSPTPGASLTATETIPPNTPLATLTPSRTLIPPPTFEPPTLTLFPSSTPLPSATATLLSGVSIPGLRGAETPTPSTTPGCVPDEDWHLTYTVQAGDAIASIAAKYGTYTNDLVQGNCLSDPNLITIGQVLRVPGDAQPVVPAVECLPFELLTPVSGTLSIPGEGTMTFNWRGSRAPRNLIRLYKPNGQTYEIVLELRQNETIDLAVIPDAGTYTWYVYPLDFNFVQVCPEGGPWTFTKAQAPTPTPTLEGSSGLPSGSP